MRSEIRLEFEERTDKDGKKYLFCRPGLPGSISLSDSVFFLWPADSPGDNPSMSIAKVRNNRGGRDANENGHYGRHDSDRDDE